MATRWNWYFLGVAIEVATATPRVRADTPKAGTDATPLRTSSGLTLMTRIRLAPRGGVGFDDLFYSPALNRLLAPAGATGIFYLVDPTSYKLSPLKAAEDAGRRYHAQRLSVSLVVPNHSQSIKRTIALIRICGGGRPSPSILLSVRSCSRSPTDAKAREELHSIPRIAWCLRAAAKAESSCSTNAKRARLWPLRQRVPAPRTGVSCCCSRIDEPPWIRQLGMRRA